VIGNDLIAVYEELYLTETLSYASEKPGTFVRVALVRVRTPTLSIQMNSSMQDMAVMTASEFSLSEALRCC
jgi:hypothetical protein